MGWVRPGRGRDPFMGGLGVDGICLQMSKREQAPSTQWRHVNRQG